MTLAGTLPPTGSDYVISVGILCHNRLPRSDHPDLDAQDKSVLVWILNTRCQILLLYLNNLDLV